MNIIKVLHSSGHIIPFSPIGYSSRKIVTIAAIASSHDTMIICIFPTMFQK